MVMTQDRKDSNWAEILIIAKGAGIVLFGTVIGTALKYVFELLVARNLGPELFGVFFLSLAVFRVLESFSTVGLHNGVLRYVALFRGENDSQRLKGTILLAAKTVLLVGGGLGLLLFVLSDVIAGSGFHKPELGQPLKFLALAIPFSGLALILLYATQGFKIMRYKIIVRRYLSLFQDPPYAAGLSSRLEAYGGDVRLRPLHHRGCGSQPSLSKGPLSGSPKKRCPTGL
jgi:O-antigen/teichoic acid export membrane protein